MSEPNSNLSAATGGSESPGPSSIREENLLILKMLQEGTISADQAAELLQAVNAGGGAATRSAPATPPAPPTPPVPPVPSSGGGTPPTGAEPEAFARARAKIAAARERVAGVQEKLAAAEEKIKEAQGAPNAWEQVADALKDVPGARSVADALRGIDPGRIAANARRQARRVARTMRTSLEDINLDFSSNWAESLQGDPTVTSPREATAAIRPGSLLRVRNTLGDVEVIGADVPEARAAGVLKIWAADAAAAKTIADEIKLVTEESADGPTIRVEHPARLRRVVLDIKVFVPENATRVTLMSPAGDVSVRNLKNSGVVLATQSGDARVNEIMGDVAVETASGDIAIQGVLGNVAASSASGDVVAVRVAGQNFRAITQSGDVDLADSTIPTVTIETVSGDATVRRISGRSLKLRAVSGDVVAEEIAYDNDTHLDTVSGCVTLSARGPLTSGTVELVTLSGDADVKLPRQTNASLEVSTKGGDLRGRVLTADGKSERELSATGMVNVTEPIGSGTGARIIISTVSGDVRVDQESPVIDMP
jgi:DUF4097 and DUF4098 domain-containing protein YvlB